MRSWASLLASPSLRVQTVPLGSQVLLGSAAGGCGEKCKSGSVLGQEQKKADIKENNQVLA